jgi:hypothetical protein
MPFGRRFQFLDISRELNAFGRGPFEKAFCGAEFGTVGDQADASPEATLV